MEYKKLPDKWIKYLMSEPESGMGYQIVVITLTDGRQFDNVVVDSASAIVEIKGSDKIPFDPNDISSIEVKPYQKYWGNK